VALKHLELVPPSLVREVGERCVRDERERNQEPPGVLLHAWGHTILVDDEDSLVMIHPSQPDNPPPTPHNLNNNSVKDRKPHVRLDSAMGLASLYAAYISPAWSDRHRAHEPLPRDVRAKLAWIPGHLLQAYSLPDNDLRLCVLQALDEIVLPRDAPCAARTTGLVHVWRRLGPEQRHALRVVLSDRAAVQRRVQAYLGARAAWRGDMEDEAHEVRLQEAGEALVEAVPPPDRRANLVGKLNETKDQ
jgi:hypothetical protein